MLKPNQTIFAHHPSTRVKVGDYVSIDGNKHRVEACWNGCINSPTGVRLIVSPATAHGRWIESCWCRLWVGDGLDWPDEEDDDGLSF